MIFLVEYDRGRGELVALQVFGDAQQEEAKASRLKLELDLNGTGVDHEVVLLEADDEAALRQTHRRYFESLSELIDPANLKKQRRAG